MNQETKNMGKGITAVPFQWNINIINYANDWKNKIIICIFVDSRKFVKYQIVATLVVAKKIST